MQSGACPASFHTPAAARAGRLCSQEPGKRQSLMGAYSPLIRMGGDRSWDYHETMDTAMEEKRWLLGDNNPPLEGCSLQFTCFFHRFRRADIAGLCLHICGVLHRIGFPDQFVSLEQTGAT